MPTPPPNYQPSPPPVLSKPNTPRRPHSLRWSEPIAQFRPIPPREEDYYATFEALPLNAYSENQEEDEPYVPFLHSLRLRPTPPPSAPEPAGLKYVFPGSEGGEDDASMNVDNVPNNKGVSPSCSGPLSELDNITLVEIGGSDMSSPPSSTSFQGHHSSNTAGYEVLQNMILLANLNPGFHTLFTLLHSLTPESDIQEPQSRQAAEVPGATNQHTQNNIGDAVSSNMQIDDPPVPQGTHESPRTPLQTNTPTSSTSPGPSNPRPPQPQDNTLTHTPQIHPGGLPHVYPAHSQPKAYHNAHTAKLNQSLPPSSPRSAQPNISTTNNIETSPSRLKPGHAAASPVTLQPHQRAQTNNITAPKQSGLGAYSKGTIIQPSRANDSGPPPPTPRTIGADGHSHLPQPVTVLQAVPGSISARPPAVHTSFTSAPGNPPPCDELECRNDDVEMGPPASESESEEGAIDEHEEGKIDDAAELEEGEIGDGRVSAVVQSHVAQNRASLVGSTLASERRQAERRERRNEALGLGAVGRRASPDMSHRTGTGEGRREGGGVRRRRARHVPSIAGHLQRSTTTATPSTSALSRPTVPKQYSPLSITTVHGWRTKLDHLKFSCTSSGVFKNPSQYQSELGNVLKQIQTNEDNPDLTVDVLKETRLLEVLKAFRHCNNGAGPGLKCFKPLVVGILKRWREKIQMLELAHTSPEVVVVGKA